MPPLTVGTGFAAAGGAEPGAELGAEPSGSRLYHIAYDGTVSDEERFTVLGGEAETISARVGASFDQGWSLAQALRASVDALKVDRELTTSQDDGAAHTHCRYDQNRNSVAIPMPMVKTTSQRC